MKVTQVSDVCCMVGGFMFTAVEEMEQINEEGGQELFRYPRWIVNPEDSELDYLAMDFLNSGSTTSDHDDFPF